MHTIFKEKAGFFALNYGIFDLSKEEKCNHKKLMREAIWQFT